MIGMSLGSGMPAVVAAWLVPLYGWQALFVAGGVVPVVVALVIVWKLPESILFLTYRGKNRRRDRSARARAGSVAGHHARYAVRAAQQGEPARSRAAASPTCSRASSRSPRRCCG